MTRRLTPMSVVMIAIAFVATGLTQSGSATAIADPDWSDGACTDNVGITIVVDFQELGGGVNVRCAPGPAANGLDALDRAGVAWEGTLRFPGFVCRVAGLPSPDDEACANTPPADAYWSYWIAPRGGDWCYANVGPNSRKPPPGSIEGWSFALDKASAKIPPPRFDVPDALPGQAPNPVSASECTTAAASSTPSTTVRPTTPAASTSTTPARPIPTTVSVGPTTTRPAVVDQPSGAGPPVTPTSTSAVAPTTTIRRGSDGVGDATSTSTDPTTVGPDVDAPEEDEDDNASAGDIDESGEGAGDNAASAADASASFDAAGSPNVASPSAEAGTVDLSNDQRGRGGFGLSSILGIVTIAAVAAAGLVAARRRNRPLRVET